MSSWPPDIGQTAEGPSSSDPSCSSAVSIGSKIAAGGKFIAPAASCVRSSGECEGKQPTSLANRRKMRDVKDVQRRLEQFVLPSVVKEEVGESSETTQKAVGGDQNMDVSVLDEDAQKRFIYQPWSFFRDFLELSKSNCDSVTEECGAKTKEKKLAVLPHSKYPMYGYCPSRDTYVVVKCKLCGMAVKPVAHRAHMHSRHNIGLKSPEPTTPVSSLVSPSFPAFSSERSPSLSTKEEASVVNDSVPVVAESTDSEAVKRTVPTMEQSLSGVPTTSKEAVLSSADNYIVVAPHSSDRPLKLTFRRERPNAATPSPSSGPIRMAGNEKKELKKLEGTISISRPNPTISRPDLRTSMTLPMSRPDSSPNIGRKSRLRQTIKTAGVAPSTGIGSRGNEATAMIIKASDSNNARPTNHAVISSMLASNSVESEQNEATTSASRLVPSASKPAPSATPSITFTAPAMVVSASNFRNNNVYEHPRPLVISRYSRVSLQQSLVMASEVPSKADRLCYFLADFNHNSVKRWPPHRRSSQTIREACRRTFISSNEFSHRQALLSKTTMEKAKSVDTTVVNKWIDQGGGQVRRILGNAHKSSSPQVSIIRQSGMNNRVVRVTTPAKNFNTAYRQQGPSIVISGGRYNNGNGSSGNTGLNNPYTKLNTGPVRSVDNGGSSSPKVAIDLVCNGDSNFPYRLEPTSVVSAMPKSADKKMPMKRHTPSSAFPSTVINSTGACYGSMSKKPRLHNHEAVIEIEEVGSIDSNGQVIQSTGNQPKVTHTLARQQLMTALHHVHETSGGVGARRKFSQPHSVRHQLTPIVVSPSHTPRCASPRPPSQQPPQQQQQVVLVSVNGPAVLTGWQKLTSNAGEHSSQQQTGLLQNGLTVTAVGAVETAVSVAGARVIRPKCPQTAVLVAHSDPRRPYTHVQGLLAQRLSSSTGTSVTTNTVQAIKRTQARTYRRTGSATASPVDDVSVFQIAQQQQPFTQYRPIQPAQPHIGLGLRSNPAVSTQQLIAAPIMFSVAAVSKGDSNTSAPASMSASPISVLGDRYTHPAPVSSSASPQREGAFV